MSASLRNFGCFSGAQIGLRPDDRVTSMNHPTAHEASTHPGLLGDTTTCDYSDKLKKFNAFAQPELRLRPYLAVEQLAA